MAKAAWCAACGANVYVNDDGFCPQGHEPENLSNFYDAPDLSPAEQAQHDAHAPFEKRKTNKSLIIVLVILGLLVLCGVGACVFGVIGYSTIVDSVTTEGETEPTTDMTPIDEPSSAGFDAETELRGLTDHFFPDFEPTTYYLVGEETDEPLTYQIVAVSESVPEFRMIFTCLRYSDASVGADDDPFWYWDTGTGAVWERGFDYEDDTGISLAELAGGDMAALLSDDRDRLITAFVDAHPGKIVSDFAASDEGEIGLLGFDESELDDWMGDTTSFESWWTTDQGGAWAETAYSE